jgi:hypothetical protein
LRRVHYYLFSAVLYLATAGCASLPEKFTRVDGRESDPNQLLTDKAMCSAAIKENLSTGNQTTSWGPTEDAITIYTGCMVQHGYRVVK